MPFSRHLLVGWNGSNTTLDFDSDLLLLGDRTRAPQRQAGLSMASPYSVWFVPSGWTPVVRRLLVPIDFSDHSAASLRAAIDVGRRFPLAKCFALHVYQPPTRFTDDEADHRHRIELMRCLEKFIGDCETNGVHIEPLLVNGFHVGRAICHAAHEHHVDLVVLTTRGRTRAASWILNSVVEAVIRDCSLAVLILKSACGPLNLLQALWERLRNTDDPQFS